MSTRLSIRGTSLFLGALIMSACASSPMMRAAESRDFPKLKSELSAREKAGTLSSSEATDLARVTVENEIASAKGEDAVTRVRDTLACASEIDGVLADRAKTHDAAGAEAALMRVEDGSMSEGSARDYASDRDDAWRAVGARGLVRESDRDARLHALADPSSQVRRSAVRAAVVAHDNADRETLFETARVDPDPMVRTEALRALSKLSPDHSPAEVANRLRDLWTNADDAMREDIAVAFAAPDVFNAGGREALRVVIGEAKGPGAIAAAGAVLREQSKDAELAASSRALLVRVLANGSRRDRMHVIAIGGANDAQLLAALRDASKDGDMSVRVAVFGRLASSKPDRDASIRALEAIAATRDGEPRVVASARFALANVGDIRVQAWLEEDLAAKDPHVRLSAASALAAIGRASRAAPLLADPDPSVRTRAACILLNAKHLAHRSP
jgi:HEAT repeat protein